jgi:hypothetical protein
LLGVTQQAVAVWLDGSNTKDCNASITDNRVKVPKDEYAGIWDRVSDGESRAQVAAIFTSNFSPNFCKAQVVDFA